MKQEEEVLIDSPLQLAQSVSQQQEEDMEGSALSFRLSEYRGTSSQLLLLSSHMFQDRKASDSVSFCFLLSDVLHSAEWWSPDQRSVAGHHEDSPLSLCPRCLIFVDASIST